jgi:hypothetical protein
MMGERPLVAVRSGVGAELGRAKSEAEAPVLSVDSVKAVIDSWADSASDQVVAWFAKK